MNLLAALEARSTTFWMVTGILFVAAMGVAEVATGREIAFSLFYLVPIVAVTWFVGRDAGLAISVAAAATWFAAELLDGQLYAHPIIRYWNAGVRLAFFVVVTLLLPALKALEHEKEIARVDPLTGAANRRHFFEAAQSELDRSQRYRRSFTVAFFDLDGFKSVNDRFGHRVGDRLLCAVVNRTKAAIRKTDLLARLGGDEFIVLLPEIDEPSAQVIVPKIQAALRDEMLQGGWPVSFSFGALTYRDGLVTPDELIRRADELMYAVKKRGKDAIAYATFTG